MNKDAQHFYDCWDLMTLTVIVGLLSLLEEILTQQSTPLEDITEAQFLQLVDEILDRINLLGRWTDDPSWGSQDFSSDELLMFSLGQHYNHFLKNYAIIDTDQLWYGVRLLAEKQATNFGDGEALVAFIRDSIGEYHLQGKVSSSTVCNYIFGSLQCIEICMVFVGEV